MKKAPKAAPVTPPGTAQSGPETFAARPCPICGKPSVFETRPFCSKRCADVDLHRWLGGSYAIPIVEEDGGKDGDPEEEP